MLSPANRRYLARYRPYRTRLAAGIALSILQALLVVPLPLLVTYAIDDAIPDDRMGLLSVLVAVMAGLAALGVVVDVAAQAMNLSATGRVTKTFRQDLLARMYSFPKRRHDSEPVASLHDRLVNDSERVDIMAGAVLSELLPSGILVAGIIAILLWLEWTLALTVVILVPILVISGQFVLRWLKGWAERFHSAFHDFSASTMRILRSQEMARIHGAEDQELSRAESELETLRVADARIGIGNTLHRSVQRGLVAVTGTAVLLVGGLAVSNDRMTLGQLLAFYAGFAILKSPASIMGTAFGRIVEGQASLVRLDELLEDPNVRPYQGTKQVELSGRLELADVSMSYGDTTILSGLSFRTEPGRVTALAGPNGSGKSTAVSLILGMYQPTHGMLLADGVPYDQLDIGALRRQLGVVPQEPFLFPGTIRENISYGHAEATDAEIRTALEHIGVPAIVQRLPKGLDTEVGDDGELLSGGQRQRIAIARALLGKPRVLLFDEPTNHLDAAAVSELLRGLQGRQKDLAVLVISHDARIMDDCDIVVRLQDGFAAAVDMN